MMRRAAITLLASCPGLAGCAAKTGKTEISAFPSLTALDDDPQKRAEQLDSADARPGPEQNKGKNQKELKAETALATLAALIGSYHSTSPNVVIGTRTRFDENRLFDPNASVDPGESLVPKLSLAPGFFPQGSPTNPASWLLMGVGWLMNWEAVSTPEPPAEEEPPAKGWLPPPTKKPAPSDDEKEPRF
jgi:hypothetical protein